MYHIKKNKENKSRYVYMTYLRLLGSYKQNFASKTPTIMNYE